MKFSLVLILALALGFAVIAPQPMAMGLEPFQIPLEFKIALVGALSALLVAGWHDRFPQIGDAALVLIGAVVTTALDWLAGLITTGVPVEFWPLLMNAFIILASWLAQWGVYHVVRKAYYTFAFRPAH